jgi:YbbR domain-containing protein
MVIVVSEESGKITLVKDNRIYDINDRSVLEKLLTKHAGQDTAAAGLKKHTRELAAAAVVCLACVTGLWMSFSRGMESLATHTIPVEFIKSDQNMEIFSSSASSVTLLISGARPLIRSLGPDRITVKLSLANTVPGTNKLAVSRSSVTLPPGIVVKNIDPAMIEVTVDVPVKKELSVQPFWTGRLSRDLIMTFAETTPEKVHVIGPRQVLTQMETLFTEPLPLDGITASGRISALIVLHPPTIRLADQDKHTISVAYTIQKRETVSP